MRACVRVAAHRGRALHHLVEQLQGLAVARRVAARVQQVGAALAEGEARQDREKKGQSRLGGEQAGWEGRRAPATGRVQVALLQSMYM